MSGYCSSLTPCMFTDGWYPRGAFSVRFLDANPATRRPCRQCECQRATPCLALPCTFPAAWALEPLPNSTPSASIPQLERVHRLDLHLHRLW